MDEHEGAARSWRDAAKLLLGRQFRLLDPMRRAFVDRKVDSANEIVEFDLQDVRDADIILVNYNKPSIGTSMEKTMPVASLSVARSYGPAPAFTSKRLARRCS